MAGAFLVLACPQASFATRPRGAVRTRVRTGSAVGVLARERTRGRAWRAVLAARSVAVVSTNQPSATMLRAAFVQRPGGTGGDAASSTGAGAGMPTSQRLAAG